MGYLLNATHATALVGIKNNFFKEELKNVDFKTYHFTVGNNVIDAFITDQIDIAYIGPGPFINAIYRDIPIHLLANSANGGTLLVKAKNNKNKPSSEKITIAVPQFGNTQDLILRKYLEEKSLLEKINIVAVPAQDTATVFFTMSCDAACLPEPWGSILLDKKICEIWVDEKEIFNNGNYPVTVLVVNKKYLKENPDIIKKFLIAHNKSNLYISNYPDEAAACIAEKIKEISKKNIDKKIIVSALKRCKFESNVDFETLFTLAKAGIHAKYYKEKLIEDLNKLRANVH